MRKSGLFNAKSRENGYKLHSLLKGGETVRIAICDDEQFFRVQLKKAMDASGVLPHDAIVEECPDGAVLVENHILNPYNIVFLDIEMEGMSGLEAGQKIRSVDNKVTIILVTSHEQYALKSFKVGPFDYVVKPVNAQVIGDVLSRALKKYEDHNYKVIFKWREGTHAIDVGDIVYIDAYGGLLQIYTEKEVFECIGSLRDHEQRLSSFGYFRCHHNYMINMHYIRSIEKACIVTTNGFEVSLSGRKRQDCLKSFNLYQAKYRV